MFFGVNNRGRIRLISKRMSYIVKVSPRVRQYPVVCSFVALALEEEVHINILHLELVAVLKGNDKSYYA